MKGGNVRQRAQEARDEPWITGVECQRLFPRGAGSQWFEVNRGSVATKTDEEDPAVESVWALFKAKEEEFESNVTPIMIEAGNDKTEANTWLSFVGWARHLQGLDWRQTQETAEPIQEDETTLQGMWETMEAVIKQARVMANPFKVGSAVLFDVKRKDVDVKPRRPFDKRMEDDSWIRYKGVYRQVSSVIQRGQRVGDKERAP